MVQVIYTKEQGLKQQSGDALISLPEDVVITRPISQTVTGNTVSVLDFGAIHHDQGGAEVDEIDFQSKYIIFKTPASEPATFYVWFNVDAAGADPFAGVQGAGTSIEIAVAAADLDSPEDVASQIATALANTPTFDNELKAENDGTTVKITARRMGVTKGCITDVSQFTNVTATDGETIVSVSRSVDNSVAEGSHVLSGLGVVKVKDALINDAKDSFVVVKDLPADTNYGVRLVVLSELPQPVNVLTQDLQVTLAQLDTAGDATQLVWNGTAWKSIYRP